MARITEFSKTPEELIEESHKEIRDALIDEVMQTVKEASDTFFERLVVKLLVAMGYGGSIEDAGKAVGKSGDGGIDGVIKEDKLGLDVVVIQAKRWISNHVGRPDVQSFAGSMEEGRQESWAGLNWLLSVSVICRSVESGFSMRLPLR